jgi:ubiquinone biosynthesis protein UbiJ
MLDPGRAKGVDARIGLRLGEESFLAHLSESRIAIARSPLDAADVTFTGPPPVIAGAIYGGQMAALESAGALRVEGNRQLAEWFVTLFPLPPKAERPA